VRPSAQFSASFGGLNVLSQIPSSFRSLRRFASGGNPGHGRSHIEHDSRLRHISTGAVRIVSSLSLCVAGETGVTGRFPARLDLKAQPALLGLRAPLEQAVQPAQPA